MRIHCRLVRASVALQVPEVGLCVLLMMENRCLRVPGSHRLLRLIVLSPELAIVLGG